MSRVRRHAFPYFLGGSYSDRGAARDRLLRFLVDEAVKRRDAAPRLASPQEARAVDIPRRKIGPRPAAPIFVLDASRAPRRDRGRRMATLPGLNAGFFIRRNHVVARSQWASVPAALVQIQNRVGAFGEPRVAGKQPTAMAPRPDGVRIQPPPERRAADGGDESARHHFAAQIRQRPPGQWHAQVHGKFTRDPLDLDDDVGGKSGLGARLAAPHRDRRGVGRRSGGATC